MNEYDWLTCEDSMPMLEYLHSNHAKIYQEWRSFVAGKAKDDGSTVRDYLEYVVKTINFGVYSKDAANLIREVVGNPFRPVFTDTTVAGTVTITTEMMASAKSLGGGIYQYEFGKPSWITPDVFYFAANIIDSGDYNSVDVLADLLEEAGCDNEEILRHLRGEVRVTYPPMRIETSIASINSSQSVNLTCGSADDESLVNWDLAIFDRDWNHKKLETTVTSYQGDLKTVTFQKPCCSIFCGDNAVLSIQHKAWLPKPVPCQPGCWVLRLLTEEK